MIIYRDFSNSVLQLKSMNIGTTRKLVLRLRNQSNMPKNHKIN